MPFINLLTENDPSYRGLGVDAIVGGIDYFNHDGVVREIEVSVRLASPCWFS